MCHTAAELRAGTIQLGVWACASEPPPSSIRLGTDEIVALMHPSHPLASATFLTLGQLDGETVLTLADETTIKATDVSLPNADAMKQAAEQRVGLAILPRRSARVELHTGRLIAAPLAHGNRRICI
jgi:DNA-binding transcriptional LysR family regulator